MGKVMSSVARRANQRFNIENRAQRVIAQDKPTPAPKYEADAKELERILKDHPEFVEQAGKKDATLDDRLKQVFVTSSSYLEQRRQLNPDKPLPTARTQVEDFEYGYQEPDIKKVSLGKCTLRQAIQFISDHQEKPSEWTAARIADEFKVHIPKTEGKTKKFLIDPKKTGNFDKLLEDSTIKKKSTA